MIETLYVVLRTWLRKKLINLFQKRRKTKGPELSPAVREKMKKAFLECHKAVMACEDETGRRRCDLFKELPDKRVSYPLAYGTAGSLTDMTST